MNSPVQQTPPGASPRKGTRAYDQRRYFTCRSNLLVMTVFTLANLILVALDVDFSLSFSAILPLFLCSFGKELAAKTGAAALFPLAIVLAALLILLFFLCWLFSAKRYGWLIPALVFYAADTVLLLSMITPERLLTMIIEIVFHAWVLYYLIAGIIAGRRLTKEKDAFLSPSRADREPPSPV